MLLKEQGWRYLSSEHKTTAFKVFPQRPFKTIFFIQRSGSLFMLWRYLLFSIIIYNSPALFTLFCCPETSHKDTFGSFPLMLYSAYVVGFFQ